MTLAAQTVGCGPNDRKAHTSASTTASSRLLNELRSLRRSYEERGLFSPSRARLLVEVLGCLALYALGHVCYTDAPIVALGLHLFAVITMVWWIHDAGHGAFFEARRHSKVAAEALGVFYLGMPQIEYHFGPHRRHHGFTNILGRDQALDTGPIAWHPAQVDPSRRWLLRLQPFVWSFLILPLTCPLMIVRYTQELVQLRAHGRLLLLVARWALMLWLFQDRLVLLLLPPMVAGYVLGLAASLNHFHMPITLERERAFPASVFAVTQNLSHRGRLCTWLMGGLNFHVEHHLFPDLPSRSLREVSADVQRLAAEHGLPYHSASLGTCLGALWTQLGSLDEDTQVEPTGIAAGWALETAA